MTIEIGFDHLHIEKVNGISFITQDAFARTIHGANANKTVWKRTGQIGLLPLDARLRLRKAAETENPRERHKAIRDADAWVKSTYPEYFQPAKE